jgi:hypothetical protein
MATRYFYGYTPTGKFVFELTAERLLATPRWESNEPNPPLPAREAIRVGRRALSELVEHEMEWVLSGVELIEAEEVGPWFYRLSYQQLRDREGRDICIMGKPCFLPVVVLMSGEALEPESMLPDAD